MNIKPLTIIDKIAYLFLIVVFVFGVYYANTDPDYFEFSYTKEDGFAEYVTALLLLSISLLSLYRIFKFYQNKKLLWLLGTSFFVLIFFFGAGEEVSWGQRLFNIESSTYFLENNAQGETNLHNMVVDGKKVNKLIFSQLLTLVLVFYLLIFPILYRNVLWIKNLTNQFAVPVVKWHHTIAFILCTALVLSMPSNRKWELYELAFGVIFFLIFLNPLNSEVFKAKPQTSA